jgi:hypothetical protein
MARSPGYRNAIGKSCKVVLLRGLGPIKKQNLEALDLLMPGRLPQTPALFILLSFSNFATHPIPFALSLACPEPVEGSKGFVQRR